MHRHTGSSNRTGQPAYKLDWKRELKKIIEANNKNHSSKDKIVSTETKGNRSEILFQAFTRLRILGYKLDKSKKSKGEALRCIIEILDIGKSITVNDSEAHQCTKSILRLDRARQYD